MPQFTDFAEYIIDLLSPLGNITAKRMFSGILLSRNSQQIGVAAGEFSVIDLQAAGAEGVVDSLEDVETFDLILQKLGR